MKQYNGNRGLTRINKTVAQRLYDSGEAILLAPCNINLDSAFGSAYSLTIKDTTNPIHFTTLCNAFRYYNCSNKLGKNIAFYTPVK